MRLILLALLFISEQVATVTAASSSSSSISSSGSASIESTSYAAYLTELPTDARATYHAFQSTVTLSSSTYTNTTRSVNNGTIAASVGTSRTTAMSSISSTSTRTILEGTATRSQSSEPTSNVRCNGYSEFCNRKYSNVTYVVAHNSPFHVPNNAASNQMLDVNTQLDDGIRGLQSETHYVNDTVFLCHTSCDELNAGTLEAYLVKVKSWLDANRLEVVTILLGNEDFIDPGNYTAPVTNSGLLDYVYTPPTQPMDIDGWPTLGDMILSNKRVVMMLAYDANQQKVPWLLDMWSYQWQTPFSPTNVSFPCTVQRPPGQDRETSERRLILANHNLNVDLDVQTLDINILIPNFVELTNTNANTTSLGAASETINQCTNEWGRPPNFLLVDYYNIGNFNGSTLAAAAQANNVTYNVNSCCGHGSQSTATDLRPSLTTLCCAVIVLVAAMHG